MSDTDGQKIEIRPVKPHEIEDVENCINRSFSQKLSQSWRQDFFKKLDYIPRDRAEFFWGVFIDGIPVSGVLLYPFSIMLDYTPIHLLQMTGLGTDLNYRHRGFASQLIQQVHNNIQMEGFDGIALHSAADDLYRKNGYQTVFWDYTLRLDWSPSVDSTIRHLFEKYDPREKHIQFFEKEKISEVITEELYQIRRRSTQFIIRKIRQIRYPFYFHQRLQQHIDSGAVLVTISEHQRIIAYALAKYQVNNLEILEQYSLLNDPTDFLLLWDRLQSEYSHNNLHFIIKTYPTDEIVLDLAKKMGFSLVEEHETKNMVHLYDPSIILPWMQTTFSHRIQTSSFHDLDELFLIQVENWLFQFRITKNIVSLTEITNDLNNNATSVYHHNRLPKFNLNKRQWIAITFGYYSIASIFNDIIEYCDKGMLTHYQTVLSLLFPQINAVWDYFDPL